MTSTSHLHNRQGFSLVEVMVAMLIMTIGVSGSLTMIIASMKANTRANLLTTKTALAQQMVEDLLSMNSSDVTTVCPTALTNYNLNMTGTVSGAANYLTISGSGTYNAKCSSTQLATLLQVTLVVSTVPDDGIPLQTSIYRYLE